MANHLRRTPRLGLGTYAARKIATAKDREDPWPWREAKGRTGGTNPGGRTTTRPRGAPAPRRPRRSGTVGRRRGEAGVGLQGGEGGGKVRLPHGTPGRLSQWTARANLGGGDIHRMGIADHPDPPAVQGRIGGEAAGTGREVTSRMGGADAHGTPPMRMAAPDSRTDASQGWLPRLAVRHLWLGSVVAASTVGKGPPPSRDPTVSRREGVTSPAGATPTLASGGGQPRRWGTGARAPSLAHAGTQRPGAGSPSPGEAPARRPGLASPRPGPGQVCPSRHASPGGDPS